jgi:hypothetical protein
MTTIVYRDGVMAGDGTETSIGEDESPMILTRNCVKVFRLPSGELFGASRGSEDCERLKHSLMKGLPAPKLEDINGLRVDLKGRIWLYEGNIWQHVGADTGYYAVGVGSVFAFPLLKAGHGAIEACRIAKELDPFSGGKLTYVKLAGWKSKRKAKR